MSRVWDVCGYEPDHDESDRYDDDRAERTCRPTHGEPCGECSACGGEGGDCADDDDDGDVYDPRDIIDAIERLAVHEPDVAQRLLDASRLERLIGRGPRMGHQRCERLDRRAASAGCAEDYAMRRELCQTLIIEAQVHGPVEAKELRDQRVAR